MIINASDNTNTDRQKAAANCPGWDEHEDSHMENFEFDTLKSDHLISSGFCLDCHTHRLPDFLPAEYSSLHKGHRAREKTIHAINAIQEHRDIRFQELMKRPNSR